MKQDQSHQKSKNYNDIILEHAYHPHRQGRIKNPDYQKTATNTSCGDEITIMLKYNQDNRIADVSWTGKGCAISQASADIICSRIMKEPIEENILMDIIKSMPGRYNCVATAVRAFMDNPQTRIEIQEILKT